jgi:3-methyladenine DNA glycosylase AlkD
MKRAAAVSLIIPAKRGKYLAEVFVMADRLLTDGDDMVQKGYGWLLKEASRLHQDEVYDYVIRHKHVMPRTALRYAIELMPKEMKVEAMRRT